MTLSIVIPCFNDKHYIKSCFKAILNQTIPPDEVVFVDNNSTDGSYHDVKRYSKKLNIILVKEKHQGIEFARKTGYALVTSDLIGTIDVDSIIAPNWVETAKREFTKNKNLACLSGRCYFRDKNFLINIFVFFNFVSYGIFRWMFQYWGCNAVFSKKVYNEVGGLEQLKMRYPCDDTYLSEQFIRSKYDLKIGLNLIANVIADTDIRRYLNSIITLLKIKFAFNA
ncbi:MAG: glycosyltransferase family A protein [Candidatus Amesbacteria bacterium]|nr:glycosyltransferase family A protein [Candidatus Amesbacteria bacterium]